MALTHIRIVLIKTSHPGNIGAVARAMKTMCLHELYLVDPRFFPHADATTRASGADDVLASARLCATLDEALQGCTLVFGASARLRTIAWPQLSPRECASLAVARAPASVALVIGHERIGLTNDELERCNYLVNIPSNPAFSSLNMAAAVQVLAYELLLADLTSASTPAPQETPEMATADELELLFVHLQQTLTEIEFLDPANPRQLMRRLRRLCNRVQLEKMEVNMLRGILVAAQGKAGR